MATVNWNLIEGETATLNREGWTATRGIIVSDIGSSYEGQEKIYRGFQSLGVEIGERHPTYPYSYLQSVSGTALSSDIVKYDLTYEPMKNVPPEITVSGKLASVQTNLDVSGDPITVSYTFPSDYKHDPNRANQTDTVTKQLNKSIPSATITVKRREIITGSQLAERALYYEGTVNNSGWNIRPYDDANTWMCSTIDGQLAGYILDGSLYYVYDTVYVWEYQSEGWNQKIIYVDPNTGDPVPPDAEGNYPPETNKEVILYPQIDFSPLTIDL